MPDSEYDKDTLLESNFGPLRYSSNLRQRLRLLPRSFLKLGAIVLISLCLASLAYIPLRTAIERRAHPALAAAPITIKSASGLHLLLNDSFLNTLSHSTATCDAAFPRLYDAAIKTGQYYRKQGGLTQAHLDAAQADDPNARVVIKGNRLFIKHYRPGYQSRVMAVLHSLHEAVS